MQIKLFMYILFLIFKKLTPQTFNNLLIPIIISVTNFNLLREKPFAHFLTVKQTITGLFTFNL